MQKEEWGCCRAFLARFHKKYKQQYELDQCARDLIASPPQVQILDAQNVLDWRSLRFYNRQNELSRVVLIVKTIRNNFFHGGKHAHDDWDQPERTKSLLEKGKNILDNLANIDAKFILIITAYIEQ
jgi:hypothetical protein